MPSPTIERADEIPLLIYWLQKMQVEVMIDRILPPPHGNRQGLSYGQLALLFVVYVIYLRNHRLCGMEEWVGQHHGLLQQQTGWMIQGKDATDDRLGDLLRELGEDESRGERLQQELGRHLIQAYQLPTERGRYDTTSFSVHHAPDEQGRAAQGWLAFGHSKDHRPDLLQFKQGLGTLDPAGVPLYTATVAGNGADDPLYVPAWRQMSQTIGHRHFLFIADSKAAALLSRGQIDAEKGTYLFPLPMTGKTPEVLRAWVRQPPVEAEAIILSDRQDKEGQAVQVGQGFVMELGMYVLLEDGQTRHHWRERWLVTRSDKLAQRRQADLEKRLQQAETDLARLNPKGKATATDLEAAAQKVLERRRVVGLLAVTVTETVTQQVRQVGPGRPGPQRPTEVVCLCQTSLSVCRQATTIAETQQLAGWRIHVTNATPEALDLTQAIDYYRDEYLVEHGLHRFKRGSLPVLPLFLQIPERIRGLMVLLLIALQVLTLLEFVVQQQLRQRGEMMSGLVPGNPKMKTAHPSAERLLARFTGLHWLGEGSGGTIVEELTPLQKYILDVLGIPETVYRLVPTISAHNSLSSS
jgi:transposase